MRAAGSTLGPPASLQPLLVQLVVKLSRQLRCSSSLGHKPSLTARRAPRRAPPLCASGTTPPPSSLPPLAPLRAACSATRPNPFPSSTTTPRSRSGTSLSPHNRGGRSRPLVVDRSAGSRAATSAAGTRRRSCRSYLSAFSRAHR